MKTLVGGIGLFALAVVSGLLSCASEEAQFKRACLDYCDAQASAGCEQVTIPLDQCRAACDQYEAQLGGVCIAEYAASFECAAAAGFECFMGFPIPAGGACTSEALAMSSCLDSAGCTSYCEEALASGCATDMASCEMMCQAEREAYEESFCDFEYDDLLTCWGQSGVECVDGQAAVGSCGEEVLEVGDCLAWDDVCMGYCWASDRFGCSDNCSEECTTNIADPSCGRDYEDLIECVVRDYEASCVDGQLFASFCDYEREQYQSCLSGA